MSNLMVTIAIVSAVIVVVQFYAYFNWYKR